MCLSSSSPTVITFPIINHPHQSSTSVIVHHYIDMQLSSKVHSLYTWYCTVCVFVQLPSCVQLFVTPWTVQPIRCLCSWNSPGKNTGVGCHALLQGIFPTQGSNPGHLHCRQILYHLSHEGSFVYVETCKICKCKIQKYINIKDM